MAQSPAEILGPWFFKTVLLSVAGTASEDGTKLTSWALMRPTLGPQPHPEAVSAVGGATFVYLLQIFTALSVSALIAETL